MYDTTGYRVEPQWVRRVLDLCRQHAYDHARAGSAMSPHLETQLILQSLLVTVFLEPWTWVTIVALGPSQQIVAHRDQPLPKGVFRYHIPLQSNPFCWSLSDGEWQKLQTGKIYRMAPDVLHGAVNWGSETRLHLMIDCLGLVGEAQEPPLPWHEEDGHGQNP